MANKPFAHLQFGNVPVEFSGHRSQKLLTASYLYDSLQTHDGYVPVLGIEIKKIIY